ncbi:unnamed protein product [Didymodactylos carnosus]|uniref:Reverse transcriptase domain-containing protein n=1 Tax=Didymodactylos carnosus TaxID=1234261 RepID=A0A814TW33_9BILA|nr:unnamed protein product [Didymodactylos carnosus]CAF1167051.1 unnamed protein product [Didymodactylos carnosus]CAF3590319.1 unnamed protein product [Didymodactylos carnosus]CAF3930621.1 unnamed protein product [Didymodactylos carnosus]
MPQGLKNSPSDFQRIMYDLLINTRWDYCLVYIDDVIIFSQTPEQHLNHLEEILSVLQQANLQLNPDKCLKPLQDNIEAIMKLPKPTSSKQIHSFIQAANYYRDHIKDFSKIAAPLYPCTKKNAKFQWTTTVEKAYNEIKHRLTTSPLLLSFPDDTSPLILCTDASGEGIGGILKQKTSDGLKVIKYLSKKFNPAQKRYSATEKECLGMVWCIQKLKEYLWGRSFIVEMDHCPLCSFNKKKYNNGRIDRRAVELSEYDIQQIKYKCGNCNCDADLLPRFPISEPDDDDEQPTQQ